MYGYVIAFIQLLQRFNQLFTIFQLFKRQPCVPRFPIIVRLLGSHTALIRMRECDSDLIASPLDYHPADESLSEGAQIELE